MTRAPIEATGSGKAGHPVMPKAKGSAAAREGRRAFVKAADLAAWTTMVRQMAEVLPEDLFKKRIDVAQGTVLFYTMSQMLAGNPRETEGRSATLSATTMSPEELLGIQESLSAAGKSSEEQIAEDVETDIRLRLERMDREIDELEARADRLLAAL